MKSVTAAKASNYSNVFKHVHGKGFTGVVGMEHGNFAPGREGERAVIDAYAKADGWSWIFLSQRPPRRVRRRVFYRRGP